MIKEEEEDDEIDDNPQHQYLKKIDKLMKS